MKRLKGSLDYRVVLRYLAVFFCFLFFNNVERQVVPYSVAIFVSVMAEGGSLIVTPILLLLSFLVLGNVYLCPAVAVICFTFIVVCAVYRKFNIKSRYEYIAYLAVSLLFYLFLGDTISNQDITIRLIRCGIIILLALFSLISINFLINKGFKAKADFCDSISLYALTVFFGFGVCNLTSPYIYKGVCIFLILLSSYILVDGKSMIFSAVLGVSLSIFYKNINYVSTFLLLSLSVNCLAPLSKYVQGATTITADFLINLLFNVYGYYSVYDFLPVVIASTVFCLIPKKQLQKIKDRISSFKEKLLPKEAINRNRQMVANKLYDLSNVFCEMALAFTHLKNATFDQQKATEKIVDFVMNNLCRECPSFDKCFAHRTTLSTNLYGVINLGFAKGKLSIIDLPENLTKICHRPNNLLYGINRLINEYQKKLQENKSLKEGRDLISREALSISEILRAVALECGNQLNFSGKTERILSSHLKKEGFIVSELLVYGDGENFAVSLIIKMKEFSLENLILALSKKVGFNLCLDKKGNLAPNKTYLSFKRACPFDAVYGVAFAKKEDSSTSGDTHSALRLNHNRMLFALSDGMGSGENANANSTASLSLIESFFKAGLNSQVVLDSVNKLLALNTQDSFTAIDVCILDLATLEVDFIKFGSPYGFIISSKGIKIVQGNNLPLGIVEEVKPAVATATLEDGDMILLVTDGVSDAFGSSMAIIDFLHDQPSLNPQTLANNVVERAKNLNANSPRDDMTALAVRIFAKKPAM